MIEVYHGTSEKVDSPLVNVGRDGLDFGKGFYITRRMKQAEDWALRTARQRKESPVVNVYDFDIEEVVKKYRFRKFDAYDAEWLNFIVLCRKGYDSSKEYDCVEGGIANDRVIDTIEGYINGTVDEHSALVELSKHAPNNQICILSQEVIDQCLKFKSII
ncbi:MAG: DUF3990 domain-containing protein [Paludibacteraceae bacterium]|nr:DUF3990 domain-containing protein [Paludibacteraceae bacterium]